MTSATRKPRVASIMTTCAVWVGSARNSVCPEKAIPDSLITPLCTRGGDHAGEVPVRAALAGAGQGLQYERRRWPCPSCPAATLRIERCIPDIQAVGGSGTSGQLSGVAGSTSTHAQLRGPLKEQVAAGNGYQGVVARRAEATSRRRSRDLLPAGSPGVGAKRLGFTALPGRRQGV